MTPNEYKKVYEKFMDEDEVYYVSEHRGSYNNEKELPDIVNDNADFTLFPISITRFAAVEAAEEFKKIGIKVNVIHINQIKPFNIKEEYLPYITDGLVIDDDYVDGVAKPIAFDVQKMTNKNIHVLGLENKTAGFYKQVDNLPPNKEKIMEKVNDYI
jgi:pyruvate/2-oxoacid:ferredoxin oxidoreductase alpha subunit